MPLLQSAAPVVEGTDGQWVSTQQYGWIWIPYAQADTYVSPVGSPYEHVCPPAVGWNWVYAPWVLSWGPEPYWGVYGRRRFGWYSHPWFVRPGSYGVGYRGAVTADPVMLGPAIAREMLEAAYLHEGPVVADAEVIDNNGGHTLAAKARNNSMMADRSKLDALSVSHAQIPRCSVTQLSRLARLTCAPATGTMLAGIVSWTRRDHPGWVEIERRE